VPHPASTHDLYLHKGMVERRALKSLAIWTRNLGLGAVVLFMTERTMEFWSGGYRLG
jgi:hypothetical protein